MHSPAPRCSPLLPLQPGRLPRPPDDRAQGHLALVLDELERRPLLHARQLGLQRPLLRRESRHPVWHRRQRQRPGLRQRQPHLHRHLQPYKGDRHSLPDREGPDRPAGPQAEVEVEALPRLPRADAACDGHPRADARRCVLPRLACCASVRLYSDVAIGFGTGRSSAIDGKNVCRIGLERYASATVVSYDLVLVAFLTAVFVRSLLSSRAQLVSPVIRSVAIRSLVAAVLSMAVNGANVRLGPLLWSDTPLADPAPSSAQAIFLIVHPLELSYVCMMACGSDVIVNSWSGSAFRTSIVLARARLTFPLVLRQSSSSQPRSPSATTRAATTRSARRPRSVPSTAASTRSLARTSLARATARSSLALFGRRCASRTTARECRSTTMTTTSPPDPTRLAARASASRMGAQETKLLPPTSPEPTRWRAAGPPSSSPSRRSPTTDIGRRRRRNACRRPLPSEPSCRAALFCVPTLVCISSHAQPVFSKNVVMHVPLASQGRSGVGQASGQ